MPTAKVLIFETHDELYQFAAFYFQRLAEEAVANFGRFLVALSGGGTPQPLYRLLAVSPFGDNLPWRQTHVFWGDERMVSSNHPESNYHQARELLLDQVPIPAANIHPIPGDEDPEVAVENVTEMLQTFASEGRVLPRFDLVLLGMGSDGHTASLFPGSPFPTEGSQPVKAVTAEYSDRPTTRVTLTPLVFNDARHVLFLVTGASKANALATILNEDADPVRYPARRVQPLDGTLMWLVDEAAASQLAN